ncbi:MAG: formate dehydrogenase-N subunit alpha, partial [Pseudomonadota bacterium]
IDGDPDHPINEGSLCAKGAALYQTSSNNPTRLKKVLYRAPGSDKWQDKSWEWALTEIAKRVKGTRDKSFIEKNSKGQVVNRVESIAHVGSAAMDNEELWPLQAMMRALGLVYIEHQARLCHSSTVPALAESFGRGAMTNHWIDLKNSDCILAMGSNPASNHPISMKWVQKAKDKGGKLISVDPRFTNTSSVADLYAPIRSGTDIAFLGGMIKFIIDNKKFFNDYVVEYTNASLIVGDKFGFEDGLFSGYDKGKRAYDKSTWAYKKDEKGNILRDMTLQDPKCVFRLLSKHYSRYTPEKVSEITGTPIQELLKVYETYASTGVKDKAGTIMYAMGWTQHTVGVQNIRTMAMIQLLLGNIGIPGGGVNAMRGESNVQGSTDHALLFHILPGYLKTPNANQKTLKEYNDQSTPKASDPRSVNWWANYPKYSVSLLKAMWDDKASSENDFGYSWLPKLEPGIDYSWLTLFDEMYNGKIKGFFAWGQNPACSGANAHKVRNALGKLDWLVNVNIFDNETGSFWKGPGMNPKEIKTEVFMLPCAASMEKEGSITNSGRWAQWRYTAAAPPGMAKPDGDILHELMAKIKELYKKGGKFPDPIVNLKWDYANDKGHFDSHKAAKQINGYFLKDVEIQGKKFNKGDLVPAFPMLQADGSTSSGCWIYSGSYTNDGNMMSRRKKDDPTGLGLYPGWTWAWPVNRRILYNRAAVDKNGQPWNPEKPIIKWSEGKWVGDVPDGPAPPLADEKNGKYPFIMTAEGFGRLFGPGLNDGPFPEHYEPLECPLPKNPLSGQYTNPAIRIFGGKMDKHLTCDPRFPFVATTFRLTEHWQTGIMTRWQPWLIEAQPQMFVEISEQLAKMRGIQNGEKVKVSSARGELECSAIVTTRFQPLRLGDVTVHQVGMPWCFGWITPKDGGESANLLTPNVGDANTMIPETKAFMVNVAKA